MSTKLVQFFSLEPSEIQNTQPTAPSCNLLDQTAAPATYEAGDLLQIPLQTTIPLQRQNTALFSQCCTSPMKSFLPFLQSTPADQHRQKKKKKTHSHHSHRQNNSTIPNPPFTSQNLITIKKTLTLTPENHSLTLLSALPLPPHPHKHETKPLSRARALSLSISVCLSLSLSSYHEHHSLLVKKLPCTSTAHQDLKTLALHHEHRGSHGWWNATHMQASERGTAGWL